MTGKTAVIDWVLRVIKYGCLTGATYCIQHLVFIAVIVLVILAASADYWAQILIIRREGEPDA